LRNIINIKNLIQEIYKNSYIYSRFYIPCIECFTYNLLCGNRVRQSKMFFPRSIISSFNFLKVFHETHRILNFIPHCYFNNFYLRLLCGRLEYSIGCIIEKICYMAFANKNDLISNLMKNM